MNLHKYESQFKEKLVTYRKKVQCLIKYNAIIISEFLHILYLHNNLPDMHQEKIFIMLLPISIMLHELLYRYKETK